MSLNSDVLVSGGSSLSSAQVFHRCLGLQVWHPFFRVYSSVIGITTLSPSLSDPQLARENVRRFEMLPYLLVASMFAQIFISIQGRYVTTYMVWGHCSDLLGLYYKTLSGQDSWCCLVSRSLQHKEHKVISTKMTPVTTLNSSNWEDDLSHYYTPSLRSHRRLDGTPLHAQPFW